MLRSECQRLKINELVRIVHPRQPHPKILVMIEAYLDESGIHKGAVVCFIAGYWGRPGAWKKQEKLWRKILTDAEVPLDKFHADDLIEHRKFFFNMPRPKHKKLIDDLAACVAQFRLYPLCFGLILDDFHALSMPQKRFFTGATIDDRRKPGKLITPGCPSKPYFMPFSHCVRRVLDYTPPGTKAHFFFGLDRPFFDYAMEMFKMIAQRTDKPHSPKLGDVSAPKAKETPQLQAADFLSYVGYKHMLERHAANDWNVMPEGTFRTLLTNQKKPEDTQFFNHEVIAESLQMTYDRAGNWDGHPEEKAG